MKDFPLAPFLSGRPTSIAYNWAMKSQDGVQGQGWGPRPTSIAYNWAMKSQDGVQALVLLGPDLAQCVYVQVRGAGSHLKGDSD